MDWYYGRKKKKPTLEKEKKSAWRIDFAFNFSRFESVSISIHAKRRYNAWVFHNYAAIPSIWLVSISQKCVIVCWKISNVVQLTMNESFIKMMIRDLFVQFDSAKASRIIRLKWILCVFCVHGLTDYYHLHALSCNSFALGNQ